MGIIRKTKPVKLILEAFEASPNAISIVDLVKRFESKMNKTTVYRVLERLEQEGILHSFTGNSGLTWVAKYSNDDKHNRQYSHPHFQCTDCGKSECLNIDISIPKLPNHKVKNANIILTGQCENCITT